MEETTWVAFSSSSNMVRYVTLAKWLWFSDLVLVTFLEVYVTELTCELLLEELTYLAEPSTVTAPLPISSSEQFSEQDRHSKVTA